MRCEKYNPSFRGTHHEDEDNCFSSEPTFYVSGLWKVCVIASLTVSPRFSVPYRRRRQIASGTSDDKRQLLTVHAASIYQDHLTARRGSLSRTRLIIPRCVPRYTRTSRRYELN